jgi:hypothetical protein
MFGTYTVTLDDGSEHTVTADNRDFIAFRRRGFHDLGYDSPEPLTRAMSDTGGNVAAQGIEMLEFLAWLVWHAGTRIGEWTTDYVTFTEKECASFGLVSDEQPDPTRAASPATSPS